MHVPRRADLGTVGFVGSVGDQIDAELTLGRLNGGVNLTGGNVEAFGVKLEMMDQRFHRPLHLAPLRRADLAARHHVALAVGRAQFGNRLMNDLQALLHLGHAAQIAVIAIAVLANRNLEVELGIKLIRLAAAQVPCKAGTAHHHARITPVRDVLFRDNPDVGIALLEDAVFGQEPMQVAQDTREFLRPLFDIVDQRGRQVLVHTTGAEIGGVQTRAAGAFIEHHQLFALFKAPKRRGQRANVHGLRGDVQKVVQNAADFRIEDADQACPARHRRVGQLFNRQAPGMFLVHRRHIIQPVEIGQVLQIGPAFHQLFSAAMEQADMGVAAFDDLAVKL